MAPAARIATTTPVTPDRRCMYVPPPCRRPSRRPRRGCAWRIGHVTAGARCASATCPAGPTPVACGCGLAAARLRSEEHTSELQSRENLVCRLLLEKKKKKIKHQA